MYVEYIEKLQQSNPTLQEVLECDKAFNQSSSYSLQLSFKNRKWWSTDDKTKEYCLVLRTWTTQADKPDYDTLRWLTPSEAYILSKRGIYCSIDIQKPKIKIKMAQGECS